MRLMIDLETMSTRHDATIVQIGACLFSGEGFKIQVDLGSCVARGLRVDASTIQWWLKQSDAARESITADGALPLPDALQAFSSALASAGFTSTDEVWAMPASFDVVILENAYKVCGLPVPWSYRSVRCLRTLAAVCPDVPRVSAGVAHDALSDAQAQAKWAQACLDRLGVA